MVVGFGVNRCTGCVSLEVGPSIFTSVHKAHDTKPTERPVRVRKRETRGQEVKGIIKVVNLGCELPRTV